MNAAKTETWTLQVNDAGAWRNVCSVPVELVPDVSNAVGAIARALGPRPKWKMIAVVEGYPHERRDDRELRACFGPCLDVPPEKIQDQIAIKLMVAGTAFGICALPELELLEKLERLFWQGVRFGVQAAKTQPEG